MLTEQVAELKRELGKNSSNSHKPPSSDGVGRRKSVRKPKKPSGRKRGGQPGHKGSRRAMLAAELVDTVVDIFKHNGDCKERSWNRGKDLGSGIAGIAGRNEAEPQTPNKPCSRLARW